MCGKVDIGCHIHEGFQSIATSALDQMKEGTNEAALSTLHSLATFWIRPGSPALADDKTWTDSQTVGFMHDRLLWLTGVVFLVAVLIAGMRTAWEQRARPLQELLKATLIFVAVGAAGTAVLQLLTTFSDEFAVDIIHQAGADPSLETAFGGEVDKHGDLVHGLVAQNVPTLLAISLYGSVIIASLIQIVLMMVRSAMLVLLAGTFPLAAAATSTEIGRNWFKKYCSWSLAFIAYKPAAALIYAAALQLSKSNLLASGDSVIQAHDRDDDAPARDLRAPGTAPLRRAGHCGGRRRERRDGQRGGRSWRSCHRRHQHRPLRLRRWFERWWGIRVGRWRRIRCEDGRCGGRCHCRSCRCGPRCRPQSRRECCRGGRTLGR